MNSEITLPIDTAPKDGRRILIKTVTFGWSSDICQNVVTGDKWVEARWGKDLSGNEKWLEWCGNDKTHTTDSLTPLAWAPVPAISAGQAKPVAVKPLEWSVGDWTFVAHTPFGDYVAHENRDQWQATGLMRGLFTSIDTFQSAAQSDYEARIRSALVSPAVPGEVRAQLALIKHLAEYTTEKNWADKRLYIMQAVDRALSPLPLVGQKEGDSTPAPVDRLGGSLQSFVDAAYELSTWAACINWRGKENQKEWLEELRERIELVQRMSAEIRAAVTAPASKLRVTGFRGNPLRVVLSSGQEATVTQNLIDAFASPSPFDGSRGDLGITKEWFERRAKAEADLEIGVGFSVVNMTDADISRMEVLAERALPKWAQDELARLRAIALDMQAGYVEATERAEEAVKAANALQIEMDRRRAAPASEGSAE